MVARSPARRVAYLTDVEGRWDKLVDFCAHAESVHLDAEGRLSVDEGTLFVFGGDAIDRGPSARRLVSSLLDAKLAHPDRLVLLAGNRDINKLRLVRELGGHPPRRTPDDVRAGTRADLLRFIFSRTMGAREAFEHRRAELATEGRSSDDEAVVTSYLDDLEPGGELTRYLSQACLAHREGETLFVHGGVTEENLFLIPGIEKRADGVDAWVEGLAAFYDASMTAFANRASDASGKPLYDELVAYQAPLAGTRQNQSSVVYGRPTNDRNQPVLPPRGVVDALSRSGVRRIVCGHTPSGDCPTLLRDEAGFELVLADNSYGRVESGSCIVVDPGGLHVHGLTELDGGRRERVDYLLPPGHPSPLGMRESSTGRLLKAELATGELLAFRSLEGYAVEQCAVSPTSLDGASLEPPR